MANSKILNFLDEEDNADQQQQDEMSAEAKAKPAVVDDLSVAKEISEVSLKSSGFLALIKGFLQILKHFMLNSVHESEPNQPRRAGHPG